MKKFALLLAAALLGAASAASATTYNWSFSATSDDNGFGSFTTNAQNEAVSGWGSFYLPGLGSTSRFTASLFTNANGTAQNTSPDGSFYYDDVFAVTNNGLLFEDKAGDYINVYAPSGLTDGLGSNPGYIGASAPGQWWIVGTQSGEAGTLTISAAPEPAAWSLMILGVGGVGAALRTRRRKALAA